jgi:hypothetical protein
VRPEVQQPGARRSAPQGSGPAPGEPILREHRVESFGSVAAQSPRGDAIRALEVEYPERLRQRARTVRFSVGGPSIGKHRKRRSKHGDENGAVREGGSPHGMERSSFHLLSKENAARSEPFSGQVGSRWMIRRGPESVYLTSANWTIEGPSCLLSVRPWPP